MDKGYLSIRCLHLLHDYSCGLPKALPHTQRELLLVQSISHRPTRYGQNLAQNKLNQGQIGQSHSPAAGTRLQPHSSPSCRRRLSPTAGYETPQLFQHNEWGHSPAGAEALLEYLHKKQSKRTNEHKYTVPEPCWHIVGDKCQRGCPMDEEQMAKEDILGVHSVLLQRLRRSALPADWQKHPSKDWE